MAENFLLTDTCATCGCPDFFGDVSPSKIAHDAWIKIHDQKISSGSRTFTFAADAVSTGSYYTKPADLAREGIFKVTAYPVDGTRGLQTGNTNWNADSSPVLPSDCVWKSGGVTLDNSFYRDCSSDTFAGSAGLDRETGRRWSAGNPIARTPKASDNVLHNWGWGFDEGQGTYCAHYREVSDTASGIYNFQVLDDPSLRAGAIFVYLDKTKITFGEIPSYLADANLSTDPAYDPQQHGNRYNVRPHMNRHFIDRTEGDQITGEIDSLDSRVSGVEWVVELWALQTNLPDHGDRLGNGYYAVSNLYPDKRISGVRWRRWASSGFHRQTFWPSPPSVHPVGNQFWPLWSYDVTLSRSVAFSSCPTPEILDMGLGSTPCAPWGWIPEQFYYDGAAGWVANQPYRSTYAAQTQVGLGGNMTFGISGAIGVYFMNEQFSDLPAPMPAGSGGGLLRQNTLPYDRHGPAWANRARGGLWPLLTAQPLFDDGTEGREMRMGAGFIGGDGGSGMGCNAHYPMVRNHPTYNMGFVEGEWQTGSAVTDFSTCWQLDFSPAHPQNREPDSFETCVRADGAFFHQDPTHANFGCP
jgi:hypothetical protein